MAAIAISLMCGFCGTEAPPSRCECKDVSYCNTTCQKADWKRHKCDCYVHLPKLIDYDKKTADQLELLEKLRILAWDKDDNIACMRYTENLLTEILTRKPKYQDKVREAELRDKLSALCIR